MIPLTNRSSATTQKLQAFLSGAAATTNPTVTVGSYIVPSQTKPDFAEYRSAPQFTVLAGATETDIADAPPEGSVKDINYISIYNADTASVTVTVCVDDNGTNRILIKAALASAQTLYYEDKKGWYVSDSTTGAPNGPSAILNAIINGDMEIAQRGTSFAAIADSTYSLDRWIYQKIGATVHTVTQDTDVPTVAQAGRLFTHSLKLALTTADIALAATDYCIIGQRIEGYNWRALAQRIVTVSFWIKSPITGIHCASLRNSGIDRSCVKEFTIIATNTWEKKTLTFPASPSAGTWDYTTGVGARLAICLAAGSTWQGTADSYQSSDIVATANQVNGVNTGITPYFITGVQLEAGSVATEFEGRQFQQEFALCRRYTKVYGGDSTLDAVGVGMAYSTTQAYILFPYDVPMRIVPSVSVSAATDWMVRISNANPQELTAITAEAGLSKTTGVLGITVAANLAAGDAVQLHADSTSSARLTLSSEL